MKSHLAALSASSGRPEPKVFSRRDQSTRLNQSPES